MKNMYKAAIIAALGLASVTAAQAGTAPAGDLIVGIYSSSAANTYTVDIGTFGSLVDGQTWDLSSALGTAGISLSGAQFGVVGGAPAPTRTVWQTGNPTTVTRSTVSTVESFINSIVLGVDATTDGNSWYNQTVNSGANSGLLVSTGINVNQAVGTSGILYTEVAQATLGSAPVANLAFSLDSTTGILTYGTVGSVSVPEPTSIAAFGGAGLLLLSLRNRFRKA